MSLYQLGESIRVPIPLIFKDRYFNSRDGDNWLNLYEDEGNLKVSLLVYSNSQIMDAYLD